MHGLKPRRGDVAAPSTRLSGASRSGQAALETFIVVLVVCVLLFACVCALYSLWTGKKSMRAWMIFGAVTLALLHLY